MDLTNIMENTPVPKGMELTFYVEPTPPATLLRQRDVKSFAALLKKHGEAVTFKVMAGLPTPPASHRPLPSYAHLTAVQEPLTPLRARLAAEVRPSLATPVSRPGSPEGTPQPGEAVGQWLSPDFTPTVVRPAPAGAHVVFLEDLSVEVAAGVGFEENDVAVDAEASVQLASVVDDSVATVNGDDILEIVLEDAVAGNAALTTGAHYTVTTQSAEQALAEPTAIHEDTIDVVEITTILAGVHISGAESVQDAAVEMELVEGHGEIAADGRLRFAHDENDILGSVSVLFGETDVQTDEQIEALRLEELLLRDRFEALRLPQSMGRALTGEPGASVYEASGGLFIDDTVDDLYFVQPRNEQFTIFRDPSIKNARGKVTTLENNQNIRAGLKEILRKKSEHGRLPPQWWYKAGKPTWDLWMMVIGGMDDALDTQPQTFDYSSRRDVAKVKYFWNKKDEDGQYVHKWMFSEPEGVCFDNPYAEGIIEEIKEEKEFWASVPDLGL